MGQPGHPTKYDDATLLATAGDGALIAKDATTNFWDKISINGLTQSYYRGLSMEQPAQRPVVSLSMLNLPMPLAAAIPSISLAITAHSF